MVRILIADRDLLMIKKGNRGRKFLLPKTAFAYIKRILGGLIGKKQTGDVVLLFSGSASAKALCWLLHPGLLSGFVSQEDACHRTLPALWGWHHGVPE